MTRDHTRDDKTALTIPPPENLERVRIVLVEPRSAVNVGATARAMSTMGLSDLGLVRPRAAPRSPEARFVAHNAAGVLEAARVYDDVLGACGRAVLVIGTTNRRRSRVAPAPMPVREMAAQVAQRSQERPVAILFGNEETGLQAQDLSHCHILATIPTVPASPALNLSHAVMVVAYEIFLASVSAVPAPARDLAPAPELEALCERINRLMLGGGFRPHEDDPETFLPSLRRAVRRMDLERRDVRTLHLVLRSLERLSRR